jgi:phosphate:Na+ symporter
VEEEDDLAERVIVLKDDMNRLVEQAALHQAQRLVCEDSGKFEAYSVEVDIIEKLKRIYYHSKRMAKTVLETSEREIELSEAA